MTRSNGGFVGILAVFWGFAWAAVLQWTAWGRWAARRRTWLTVVIGVGVDVLIMRLVLSARDWSRVIGIIAASSVGIIARSLHNELQEDQWRIDDLTGAGLR